MGVGAGQGARAQQVRGLANRASEAVDQEHGRYGCYSQTWGDSKGRDDYQDVCVVLNAESWKHFLAGTLSEMAATSRNKLYVACSRARGDLHVMPDTLLKTFKKARDLRHVATA